MSEQTPLPADHPIKVAWDKFRATDGYANTRRWAAHEKHVDGSLWAAFIAGYEAAQADARPDAEGEGK